MMTYPENMARTMLTPYIVKREVEVLSGEPVEVVFGDTTQDGHILIEIEFDNGGSHLPFKVPVASLLSSLDDFSRDYLQPVAAMVKKY